MSDLLGSFASPFTSAFGGLSDLLNNVAGVSPPASHPPLFSQLPAAQSAFQRKYADPQMQLALSQAPSSTANSLINYDLQRIGRGQQPLSAQQTLGGLASITTRQQATPQEPEGLFGRFAGDVRQMIDIPGIVRGAVSEVQQLPQAPEALGKALSAGNPLDVIGALQTVPGVRDIPGVFTASQLASQGPGGLLQHPLFTALDVLPFIKEPIADLANAAVTNEARLPMTADRVAQARAAFTPEWEAKNALRTELGVPQVPEPSNIALAIGQSPTLRPILHGAFAQQVGRLMGSTVGDAMQLASHDQTALRTAVNAETPFDNPALRDSTVASLNSAIKDMATYHDAIPEARRAELSNTAMLQGIDAAKVGTTDTERAFLDTASQHANAIADLAINRKWGIARDETGEIMQANEARRLTGQRTLAYEQQAALTARDNLRGFYDQPTATTFPTIDTSAILRDGLSRTGVKALAQSAAHTIDVAGYDASAVMDAAKGRPDPNRVVDAINQARTDAVQRPILSIPEIRDQIAPFRREEQFDRPGNMYSRVDELIRQGAYGKAANLYRDTVNKRIEYVHPNNDAIFDSLKRYRDAEHSVRNFTDPYFNQRNSTRIGSRLSQLEARILPARFYPKVEELTKQGLLSQFAHNADATRMIQQGMSSLLPQLKDQPELLRGIQKDALATVQQMRQAGFDPMYIHRVSPGQLNELKYPRLSDVFRVPTFAKKRTMDAAPMYAEAGLGVSHQAAEALTRIHVEGFIQNFINLFGKKYEDAVGQFLPMAESMHQMDPTRTVAEYADQLFSREWKEYNPSNIIPTQRTRLNLYPKGPDKVFIPKTTESILKDMFRQPGGFTGALDPVMNLFRMSVLAFSPRFQFNNILGGAILTGTEDPRILYTALTRWKEVREIMRTEADIPGMPPGGMGQVPADTREWAKTATPLQQVIASHSWLGGGTLQKWINQLAAKPSGEGRIAGAADYMYRMNGIVDDFYRASSYLSGHDRELHAQLTKGMAPADAEKAAQTAGVALVRKVLPQWDRISPLERNVVRSIFPFYTFAKFITSYALRYPMDHPFRIAVMQNLIRNEAADQGTWLPRNFASMFQVGHPDAKGNVTGISTQGLNPFTDVANYFTLAGFFGKVNPIISSVLETAGIDPSKGTQDLYPDIAYDPNTGTLKPRNANLIESMIGNVIPQSQLLSAILGRNKQFSGMLQGNPEAAANYLRSSIGLPNVLRPFNPAVEATKAEVQRQSLSDTVKNDALRTGDWSRAMRFQSLRPFFHTLDQLLQSNPQLFKDYMASTQSGQGDAFFTALVSRNVPGQ